MPTPGSTVSTSTTIPPAATPPSSGSTGTASETGKTVQIDVHMPVAEIKTAEQAAAIMECTPESLKGLGIPELQNLVTQYRAVIAKEFAEKINNEAKLRAEQQKSAVQVKINEAAVKANEQKAESIKKETESSAQVEAAKISAEKNAATQELTRKEQEFEIQKKEDSLKQRAAEYEADKKTKADAEKKAADESAAIELKKETEKKQAATEASKKAEAEHAKNLAETDNNLEQQKIQDEQRKRETMRQLAIETKLTEALAASIKAAQEFFRMLVGMSQQSQDWLTRLFSR